MFTKKRELDQHVRNMLEKLPGDERKQRGYIFAKHYFKINEYESAEQHLSAFLSVDKTNSAAYKMMGQVYSKLNKKEKALDAFQKSLQLNSKQHDLITEVCQLLLADNNLNPSVASYWCNFAENEKVQNDAVFGLRLKIMENGSVTEGSKIESMIFNEINNHPDDPNHRIRLVRHFLQQNKTVEAFKYCHNLLLEGCVMFGDSPEWYEVVCLVLNKYKQIPSIHKEWEYYLMLIMCLERQVFISFNSNFEEANSVDVANLIFNFDQSLYKISEMVDKINVDKNIFSYFVAHYEGQLCLHAATLIFKREIQQQKNNWRENIRRALPLLLLAFQMDVVDLSAHWTKYCNEKNKVLIQGWSREGAFRCAQAARTIFSCIKKKKKSSNVLSPSTLFETEEDLIESVRKYCSVSWRRNTFATLFCNADQKLKDQSSALVKSSRFSNIKFIIPSYVDTENFEDNAEYFRPESLEHMIYLALGRRKKLTDVHCRFFNGLSFANKNISFCGAESLNQLDIDSFLYACVIQCARQLEIESNTYENLTINNSEKPLILPFANIRKQLCTDEQSEWWRAAYKIYKNLTSSDLSETRNKLQIGIEAVRGVNGPKCDLFIVLKIANIFAQRYEEISGRPMEKTLIESRAESLYKLAIKMYKLHRKNVLEPFRKFFRYPNNSNSATERKINEYIELAVNFLASRLLKKGHHEECIDLLNGISLPFATYFQSKAYRQMDDLTNTPRKTKHLYVEKARDCLNQTLSLLQDPSIDNSHPLNSVVPHEIKNIQYSMKLTDDIESTKLMDNSNASFYEDAEEGHYTPLMTTAGSRVRRENSMTTSSPRQSELENLCKQMAGTLTFLKEEYVGLIKPEIMSLKEEISSMKNKINTLEENMKSLSVKEKARSSNAPSRDDDADLATNVLDDLCIIEDEIQNQLYAANSTNIFGNYGQSSVPQPRLSIIAPPGPQGAPNQNVNQNQMSAFQSHMYNPMHPAAAAAYYNNPMFAAKIMAEKQVLNQMGRVMLPYGLDQNLGMSPAMNQIPPALNPIPPTLESMSPNLYGLLNPQIQLPNANVPTNFRGTPQTPQFAGLVPPTNTPQTPVSIHSHSQPTNMPVFNKAFNNTPVEKGPPVNVVITSSDPLPASFKITQTQSPMVITIPPEHIKSSATKTTPFNLENTPDKFQSICADLPKQTTISFAPKQTQPSSIPNILENKTTFSFKMSSTENKNFPNMSDPKPFTFKMTTNDDKASTPAADTTLDKSAGSNLEEDLEYDPRPDFQPIIPLPDEVEVKTGEEDEECLFSSRAKLFRHFENEWKERGIGTIKILKNKENKGRILMRRDQIHKICANHGITNEMSLTIPEKEPRGFIWVANDFSDEVLSKEKFFVRFKTSDLANEFFNVFKKVSETAVPTPVKQDPPAKTDTVVPTIEKKTFSFSMNKNDSTSTPNNKDKVTPSPFANLNFGKSPSSKENATASPFANLNFGAKAVSSPVVTFGDLSAATKNPVDLNKSEEPVDEYVPTAEFAPVIPLPDLVEVVTGEENDKVLYSHRAKLFRFDKASNDWKERGLGDIKILQNKVDLGKIRLVMRREVIHKLCCNQRIYKDTHFKFHPDSKKAVMWVGQDYSENELAIETLILRFKNESICAEFMKTMEEAQSFIAAEQEDNDDDTESENVSYSDNNSSDIVADPLLTSSQGFGDKFKVKVGSWNCEACYVQNDGASTNCLACNTPKEKPAQPPAPKPDKNGPTLTSGFGDKFKPAAGSWNCKACYLSNTGTELYCKACEAPKDDTVPKKEPKSLVMEKPKTTFSFGFGAATSTEKQVTPPAASFSFGAIKGVPATFGFTPQPAASSTPSFGVGLKPDDSQFQTPSATNTSFSFATPAVSSNTHKTSFSFTLPTSAENSSNLNSKEFSFQMKPKSPGKIKSPLKGNDGSDAEDDNEVYEEEENNTYFTPVIPLPDKIDVKTGEENENVLYSHRAKLYRFVDAEWKERGLGDVKILEHKVSKSLRVVMRREQILKICLNHALTSDIEYKKKDDKSWEFVVNDFSEGELEANVFSLRFKNKEIAEEFRTAIDNALSGSSTEAAPNTPVATISSNDKPLPLYQPKLTKTKNIIKTSSLKTPDEDKENHQTEGFTFKPSSGQKENVQANLFGAKQTVFGQTEEKPKPSFAFGGFKTPESKPLFGADSKTKEDQGENKSIFGGGKPLFGQNSAPTFGQTTSIFGANVDASPKPVFGQTLFGSKSDSSKTEVEASPKPVFGQNMFGGKADVEGSPKTVFGQNMFGGKADVEASPKTVFGQNMFGGKTDVEASSKPVFSQNLFRAKSDTPKTEEEEEPSPKPVFGQTLFGGQPDAKPVFGQALFGGATDSSPKPIFGQNLFASKTEDPAVPTDLSSKPVFGQSTNIFGSNSDNNTVQPVFGQTTSIFAASKDLTPKNSTTSIFGSNANTSEGNFFKSSGVDFASLASASTNTPKIDTLSANNKVEFVGLTNNNSFSSFQKAKEKDTSGTEDGESYTNDENHDPQFEPIIDLPPEIVLSTGEENETKKFGERAKLFRFDEEAKQWKERGVGEMKVLYHNTNGTYRVLMRREQIYKLVLNHAITADFSMSEMNNNPQSYVWGAINFAEEEEKVEKLAVRFKNVDIASRFKAEIDKAIEDLKK